MLEMHANDRKDVDEAFAGDIVALAGMKETTTGDTLCAERQPIVLERMEFPDPVIELSVEPKTKADQEKMGVALNRLSAEDPSFRVSTDHESGQTIIKGMGELHLDIIVDRMRREFKVEANVGAPQVAYREYLASRSSWSYTHKKQSGGSVSSVRSRSSLPRVSVARASTSSMRSRAATSRASTSLRSRRACARPAATGALIGFPIVDFDIELLDGKYHDVDSSALAFEIAGRGAMREGAQKAGSRFLEPIMKVEVVTPEDFMGDVIGDLNSRRGQIQGTDSRGNAQVVEAMVPLANMFGYVNQLRSFTQGRAQYTMQFSHYDEVPANVAAEVKEKLA
jgi:elongation factor G